MNLINKIKLVPIHWNVGFLFSGIPHTHMYVYTELVI